MYFSHVFVHTAGLLPGLLGQLPITASSPHRIKTEVCKLRSPRKPRFTFWEHSLGTYLHFASPWELYPVRPLPTLTHCFSRIASGYKAQGLAIRCHPSAMTSRAQLQPKRPRSTRNRQDFEAKNPNSFSFLLFLQPHVPLLPVFFASLFLSILKCYTILCLMDTRNSAFTNTFLFEFTPSVK